MQKERPCSTLFFCSWNVKRSSFSADSNRRGGATCFSKTQMVPRGTEVGVLCLNLTKTFYLNNVKCHFTKNNECNHRNNPELAILACSIGIFLINLPTNIMRCLSLLLYPDCYSNETSLSRQQWCHCRKQGDSIRQSAALACPCRPLYIINTVFLLLL